MLLRRAFQEDDLPLSVPTLEDELWGRTALVVAAASLAFGLATNAAAQGLSLQHGFNDDLPAATLYGVPEEEYWQNSVPPQQLVLLAPSPWRWELNQQAAGLAAPIVEDSQWENLVRPQSFELRIYAPWASGEQHERPTPPRTSLRIQDRPIGRITDLQTVERTLRDLYNTQRQIIAVLTGNAQLPTADRLMFLGIDDAGNLAWWTLEVGSGISMNINQVSHVITLDLA